MATLNFNVEQVEPAKTFDPLPPGDYLVYIKDSDLVATKAGNGHYIAMTMEVLEGEHAGRLLWENHNIDNPNQQAVEIAKRNISAICHAVGVMAKDSSELHDKPFIVKVEIETKVGFSPRNQIKGYKAAGAGAPAPAARPVASVPPPQAAAASAAPSRPWAK